MNLADVRWLLTLLDVDVSDIPAQSEVEFIWMNLPTSWWWFVLLGGIGAGAYLVFWLYRREIDTCPMWAKIVLGCLRCAVLLVLMVVILGPALVYTKRTELMPYVVLLRDSSRSMQTDDPYLDDVVASRAANVLGSSIDEVRSQKPSRVELLQAAIEKENREFLRKLEYRGKLKVVDFSTRVERPGAPRPPRSRRMDEEAAAGDEEGKLPSVAPLPALVAEGQGTDIYKALVEGLSERHTAAIILATDGQHTGREMGRDDLISLAQQEDVPEEDRVKILAVGVGDPHKPRNLAVSDLYADPQVFPEEPFEVRAVVRGQDIGDRPVRVDLIQQRLSDDGAPAGEPQVMDSRTGEVIPESGKLDLTFKVEAGQPGLYGYTVRVEKIENESNDNDNETENPTVVRVLDDKAKVLLIAGAPTWEYRMVQRLLTREESVELKCWLQTLDEDRAQEGNGDPLTMLPVEKKDLFNFDVIMMFDPDPIEFDEAWINLLKQFVSEHAGGVLYMAGPKYAGRFLGAPRTRNMRDVLPVRLGDVGAMEVQSLLASNTRSWPLGIVDANVDLPIMRFESDPLESLSRWKSLPGIYWSFPSEGPKPAARVLIEHSDPTLRRLSGSRPLLVTGQYGSGRTVYLGFNGTWRWRKIGRNAEYFKRFWIQTTRYLIEGRSLEGRRRGYVEADKARYQLGDKVTITARDLKDENFNLYDLPEIQITLQSGDGAKKTLTVQRVPNQEGVYQTTITPRGTGRHVVRVDLPSSTADPPKIETAFSVSLPTVETNEVSLNKPLLVDLASASGGAYFEIDEIAKLPEQVPLMTRESEYRSKPRLLWDTNRALLLLVILLSVEWAMRKGFKLL